MKKIISIILCVTMLFGTAVFTATADEPQVNQAAVAQSDPSNPVDIIKNAVETMTVFLKAGLNDMEVYLKPTADPAVSELYIRFKENDGTERDNYLGVLFNSETGDVYSVNREKGIFDTGFNYNAYTKVFYATNGCWHRLFGFTPFYDLLAKLAFDYTTSRIFFDYDGKEWMVQLWKGNYIFNMFVGCEIGIYNRPAGTKNGFYYNCVTDEEMLPISVKLYDENRVYFERPAYLTWWATGFVMSNKVNPRALTVDSTIEFPNEEMCNAFVEAAQKEYGIECVVNGTVVSLVW